MTSVIEAEQRLQAEVGDTFRVYNWRQIEQMRNDLAKRGMETGSAQAEAAGLRIRLRKVWALYHALREEGRYDVSDRLRAALQEKGEA